MKGAPALALRRPTAIPVSAEIPRDDGAANPITAYLNNKFYEVAKHYTLDGHVFSPSIIVMSEATAKKLSSEDLKLVMDAAVAAGRRVRKSVENREADAAVQLKARGTEITEVADNKPWQDAVKPVVEKYGARYKKLVDQIQNTKSFSVAIHRRDASSCLQW